MPNLSSSFIAIAYATMLIAFDMVITVAYWNLEANPIVIDLGISNFVAIKVVLIVLLPIIWYQLRAKDHYIGWFLIATIISYHSIIVAANIAVIL